MAETCGMEKVYGILVQKSSKNQEKHKKTTKNDTKRFFSKSCYLGIYYAKRYREREIGFRRANSLGICADTQRHRVSSANSLGICVDTQRLDRVRRANSLGIKQTRNREEHKNRTRRINTRTPQRYQSCYHRKRHNQEEPT